MKKLICAYVLVLCLVAGCTKVHVMSVKGAGKKQKVSDPNLDGMRFYRPWPYLLVSYDDTGNIKADIIYLPDKADEQIIWSEQGVGTLDLTFDLTNGWNLTTFGANTNPKVVDTIQAATGLAKEAVAWKDRREAPRPTIARVHLYKLPWDVTTGWEKTDIMLDFEALKEELKKKSEEK